MLAGLLQAKDGGPSGRTWSYVSFCVVWEVFMVMLALYFPSADVEACFGMVTVPLVLFMLSPRSAKEEQPEELQAALQTQPPETRIGMEAPWNQLLETRNGAEAPWNAPRPSREPAAAVLGAAAAASLFTGDDDREQEAQPEAAAAPPPRRDNGEAEARLAAALRAATVAAARTAEDGLARSEEGQEALLDQSEDDDDVAQGTEGGAAASGKGKRAPLAWADEEEDDQQFLAKLSTAQKQVPPLQVDVSALELDALQKLTRDEDIVDTLGKAPPRQLRKEPRGRGQVRSGGAAGSSAGGRHSAEASQCLSTIRTLGRAGDIAGALAAIEKAMESDVVPRVQLQNALLDALVHSGDATMAGELFEQMKATGQSDVVSFNIMLRAHLGQGHHGAAENLLRQMKEHGFVTNKVTFNELLSDRVRAGDRQGMWRIVDEMRLAGIGMNRIACTILLKALNETTLPEDVDRTFSILDELNEAADEVLRSSAIEACLRVREHDRLSSLMARFGDATAATGTRPGASPATYGSMIKAHGRAHNLERTWETWHEMSRNGVRPTPVTIGCMVEALVANGAVDEAWVLVNELLSDEVHRDSINTVVYSTVLKGFSHQRQPKRCFNVLDEMRARGIERNTITYNTLLDACAECGVMERVPQVFEEMKGSGVEPDMITYSTLVKGFCLVGDLDRAIELLRDIKDDTNLVLDEIVYNSLLDGCSRQQQVDKAMKILDDMLASGVSPSNYTLSILVKLLGRARRLKQTFAMVEELRAKHGIRPNMQVYTCLIHACFLNRQLDRALAVHDSMVTDLQHQPDQKAYSVLLSGCLHAGAVEEAVRVARCAFRLPGHGLAVADTVRGPPAGVEPKLLADLAAQLKSSRAKPALLESFAEVREASGLHPDIGKSGRGRRAGKGGGKGGDGGKGQRWQWCQ